MHTNHSTIKVYWSHPASPPPMEYEITVYENGDDILAIKVPFNGTYTRNFINCSDGITDPDYDPTKITCVNSSIEITIPNSDITANYSVSMAAVDGGARSEEAGPVLAASPIIGEQITAKS